MTGSNSCDNHKKIFLQNLSQQVANTMCSVSTRVVKRDELIEIYSIFVLLNVGQYINIIGFSAIGH